MSQQMYYQPTPQGPGQFGAPAPAPQPARNGLGITALVIGIVGTLVGIPMLLFMGAGPLGILALIFGVLGLRRVKKGLATNKGVALTGTILGAVAIILAVIGGFVTVLAVHKASDEVQEQVDQITGQPKDSSGKDATDLSAGATAKYNNGVQVTVSKTTPYTVDPNTLVNGHTDGNNAFLVTITIKNTGSEVFKDPLVSATGRVDGKEVEEVNDDIHGVLHRDFGDSISPGATSKVEMVFDVPPTAKELDVEVSPDLLLDEVHWKLAL